MLCTILRDIWEVFVGFGEEDLNVQDFRQNKLSPARSSAFFMYTVFLVRSKSYWRNLGFSVEIVVENVVMQEF